MRTVSRREVMVTGVGALPFAYLATAAAAGQAGLGQTQGQAGLDPTLAACLLIMGKKQIEVCRFALEKINNDDVKAFARAEIEEHETLKKRLAELGYEPPTMSGRQVMVGRSALPQGTSEVIAVDHEVHEQCVATTKAEQSKLSGLKFDKRFVGSQLDAHYGLFDHGVVFKKHASAQMQPVLDEAKPIIERHIATCKELMEKLDAMKG